MVYSLAIGEVEVDYGCVEVDSLELEAILQLAASRVVHSSGGVVVVDS